MISVIIETISYSHTNVTSMMEISYSNTVLIHYPNTKNQMGTVVSDYNSRSPSIPEQ